MNTFFPEKDDWFGAFISLAKAGAEVAEPVIHYTNEGGIRSFKTDMGHQVRVYVAEKGDSKQLFNVDPVFIPLLDITE